MHGARDRVYVGDLQVAVDHDHSFRVKTVVQGRAIANEACLEVAASAMNDVIEIVMSLKILVVVSVNINFHSVFNEKVVSIYLSFPHKLRQNTLPAYYG